MSGRCNYTMVNGQQHEQIGGGHSSESSSSSSLDVVHGTPPGSQQSGSLATSSSSSSGGGAVTTLELHPNVILGIPEDEDPGTPSERPHMCTFCHASYKTRTHLRRHLYIHMSARPFSCQDCGKGFNRKEHLNKHMEAIHSGTKHQCGYCDKEISRMDHLKRHIKNMHTNPKGDPDKAAVLKVQLPCGQKQKAQLSFLTPSFPAGTVGQTIITPIPLSATASSSTRVKEEPPDHGRGSCSRRVEDDHSTPSMTIIPSNVVGPGQGVATLAIQSTPTQKVLVHQRLPSGSSVNLQTASNGLVGLANLSLSLGGHMPMNPGDAGGGDKKMLLQIFNCGECAATFTTEKDFTAHTRTHKPQPYRCKDCPRAYTRREKLTEHIRCVHQGQKFSCEYCGKELSRKDHVLRHIRSVHPEVYAGSFAEMNEGQIMLDDQGRLVSTISSALISPSSSGRKRKSQGASNSVSIPSIGDVGVLLRSVCHVCLKVFGTAYHLTRHIESCHSGDVRPFSCLACKKMFKRKDHLTKHMKSHCPSLKEGALPDHLTTGDLSTTESKRPSSSSTRRTSPKHPSMHSLESDPELGMLSEGSPASSKCHHTLLENLQVELGSSTASREHSSHTALTSAPSLEVGSATSERLLIDGEPHQKHSESSGFSLSVIDSFMQGNVNVVVVDEEISNFLHHPHPPPSHNMNLTTTFPCGQCQKEFSARDQLIAHLQEHANETTILQNDQHISDISFSDF